MNDKIVISSNTAKAVISLNGAELKSFICDNTEYIWYSDAKYWKRSAPFLFPVVGSLKDSQTEIEGTVYHLSQHGFLRDQEFMVITKEENKVVLENKYNEETLKIYPYKYLARIMYEIECDKLITTISIKNMSTEDMYFNLGGHPAFNCPIDDVHSFTDYTIYFENEENFDSPEVCKGGLLNFEKSVFEGRKLTKINLNKKLFDIDTILIPKVNSQKVCLLDKENKGIEFSFPGFTSLAIWTPYNEAPFICLEPWIGYNDKIQTNGMFQTKDDLVKLSSKEEFIRNYTIKVKK